MTCFLVHTWLKNVRNNTMSLLKVGQVDMIVSIISLGMQRDFLVNLRKKTHLLVPKSLALALHLLPEIIDAIFAKKLVS